MMTKNKAVLVLLGTLALGACTAGDADVPEVPERASNVRVLELARTTLEESIVISGPLRPVRGTDVATQESGTIQSLPADKGSVVKKGQVVVMLDRRLLESEMKSAEAARVLREYNEERTRRLYEANSVSKQEMLRVYTELQQAGESARIAQLRYERAAIKAPFEGVVADRYVEVGELVSPGHARGSCRRPLHAEARRLGHRAGSRCDPGGGARAGRPSTDTADWSRARCNSSGSRPTR